jgi:hypothetical protein
MTTTTSTSTSTLFGASFDAHHAAKLAQFWAALRRELADGANADNAVVLPDDVAVTGPRLAFHRVPETKTAKTASTSTSSPPTSTQSPPASSA